MRQKNALARLALWARCAALVVLGLIFFLHPPRTQAANFGDEVSDGQLLDDGASIQNLEATSNTVLGDSAEVLSTLGVDADGDGIDDGTEWELIQRYAPVLYLPLEFDWTRPASVDWYLSRVRMRFHHNDCSDCAIINYPSVNQGNLVTQYHKKKSGWLWCSHETPYQYSWTSWNSDHHFFLQAYSDAYHSGSNNPGDWPVYAHVYRNGLGNINVQYWYFWPYNDGPGSFNHEGDWEGLTVRLDANNNVSAVHLFQHNDIVTLGYGSLTWWGTHPTVWIGDGTHASYQSEGACDYYWQEGFDDSCSHNVNNRWFTWAGGKPSWEPGIQGAGVVNVGELAHPLNGQQWIRYSGRWGELGTTDTTSGPRGPAYQAKWMID